MLDHQDDGTLVEAEMEWGDPRLHWIGFVGEGGVEGGFEAIAILLAQLHLLEILKRRQHDFRRERERRHDRPGGDASIVWTVWHAARFVAKESPLVALDGALGRTWAIGGGDAPAVCAVAGESSGLVDCVLPLDIGCAAAVLEIIDAFAAHIVVLDAAKIDPDMRDLVSKERPGI